jgi:hypothetical protein
MLTLIDIIYISMIQEDLDNVKSKLEESREVMAYLKI